MRTIYPIVILSTIATAEYCDIGSYSHTGSDVAAFIQGCIDVTPEGGTLTLPAGLYSLNSGVAITQSITLTSESQSTCSLADSMSCAILQATSDFYSSFGLIHILAGATNVWLDHIILDGNRENRMFSQSATEVYYIIDTY